MFFFVFGRLNKAKEKAPQSISLPRSPQTLAKSLMWWENRTLMPPQSEQPRRSSSQIVSTQYITPGVRDAHADCSVWPVHIFFITWFPYAMGSASRGFSALRSSYGGFRVCPLRGNTLEGNLSAFFQSSRLVYSGGRKFRRWAIVFRNLVFVLFFLFSQEEERRCFFFREFIVQAWIPVPGHICWRHVSRASLSVTRELRPTLRL